MADSVTSFSTRSTGPTALGLREAEYHTAVECDRDFSPHSSLEDGEGKKGREGRNGRERKGRE